MADETEATAPEDGASRWEFFLKLHKSWREVAEVAATDARSFAERHLRAALPRGWVANYRVAREAHHVPSEQLTLLHHEWRIFREGDADAYEGHHYEAEHYIAYLNARNQLVLVYGNSLVGRRMYPEAFWERSICIPLENLGLVLPFVFSDPDTFKPNKHSHT
jgi:hypothetical protein